MLIMFYAVDLVTSAVEVRETATEVQDDFSFSFMKLKIETGFSSFGFNKMQRNIGIRYCRHRVHYVSILILGMVSCCALPERTDMYG